MVHNGCWYKRGATGSGTKLKLFYYNRVESKKASERSDLAPGVINNLWGEWKDTGRSWGT